MLIDYKVETWIRIELNDSVTEHDIREILDSPIKSHSEILDDLCELDKYSVEEITETAMWLPAEENDGWPTLEVLVDKDRKIWDNVNKYDMSEDVSTYNQ